MYTDKDGFFKYKAGYLKLNSSSPEKQAIKILDNLNYISEIPTFDVLFHTLSFSALTRALPLIPTANILQKEIV